MRGWPQKYKYKTRLFPFLLNKDGSQIKSIDIFWVPTMRKAIGSTKICFLGAYDLGKLEKLHNYLFSLIPSFSILLHV